MKKLVVAACIAAGLGLISTGASARDTYQGSCMVQWERGPILAANCMNIYGQWMQSRIDRRNCGWGGVKNLNGMLACNREAGPAPYDEYRPRRRGGPNWD